MDITVQIPQKMKMRPNTQLLLSSSDISEKNRSEVHYNYSTDSWYWVVVWEWAGEAGAASGKRRGEQKLSRKC